MTRVTVVNSAKRGTAVVRGTKNGKLAACTVGGIAGGLALLARQ